MLAVAIIVTAFPAMVFAKDTIGARITVEKIDGDVSLVKANGKKAAAKSGVKLNATESLRTAKASYAYISIDDDKVIKLDELTEVKVKKSGNKLSVDIAEGNIFFEVKEKLQDDESMSLNASSMAMSIRGTSGIIGVRKVGNEVESTAEILEGKVNIVCDKATDEEIVLKGGEEYTYSDGEEAEVESINIEEFPGFVAVELEVNPELCDKIQKDNNLDINWIMENSEELLKKEQEYNAKNYYDVFEEGSPRSVSSIKKSDNGVNKFLKSFWGKGKGLVPVQTGAITPTPLPSQAPVNTITLTPTPSPTPTVVASNNGGNNNGGNQSTTMIIVSNPGTISGENVSQNTISPSYIAPPTTTNTTTNSGSGSGSGSEYLPNTSSSSFNLLEKLAALDRLNKMLSYIKAIREEKEKEQIPTYTVAFIAHDEETVLEVQTVEEGGSAIAPEAPYVPGYTFSYWGGSINDVNSDRKIYAIYYKNSYSVYFYDTKFSENEPYTVKNEVLYGNYVSSPGNPVHEGYTFVNWTTSKVDGEGTTPDNTPITKNTNFYAHYEGDEPEPTPTLTPTPDPEENYEKIYIKYVKKYLDGSETTYESNNSYIMYEKGKFDKNQIREQLEDATINFAVMNKIDYEYYDILDGDVAMGIAYVYFQMTEKSYKDEIDDNEDSNR